MTADCGRGTQHCGTADPLCRSEPARETLPLPLLLPPAPCPRLPCPLSLPPASSLVTDKHAQELQRLTPHIYIVIMNHESHHTLQTQTVAETEDLWHVASGIVCTRLREYIFHKCMHAHTTMALQDDVTQLSAHAQGPGERGLLNIKIKKRALTYTRTHSPPPPRTGGVLYFYTSKSICNGHSMNSSQV